MWLAPIKAGAFKRELQILKLWCREGGWSKGEAMVGFLLAERYFISVWERRAVRSHDREVLAP